MNVLLNGPFTDDDLRELMEALRRIERRQPESMFRMVVDDPNRPLAEAERLLAETFPALGDTVAMRVFKRPSTNR